MWEFCLKANKQNKHLLEWLHEELKQPLKNSCGIQTLVSTPKFCHLVLAGSESPNLKQVLKEKLTDVICKHMKYDFLKSQMFFEQKDALILKLFTYFDLEIERAIVLKNLVLPSTFVLESFVAFKLHFLKQKWKKLCLLTNTNQHLLSKSENFFELAKFLLANLEQKCECLVLDFNINSAFFEDEKKATKLTNFATNQNDVFDVLVSNFSKRIKIAGQPNIEISSFLNKCFGSFVLWC